MAKAKKWTKLSSMCGYTLWLEENSQQYSIWKGNKLVQVCKDYNEAEHDFEVYVSRAM